MEFRQYQKEIIENGYNIINLHRFTYLAMEVRTGKTLTSLGIAQRLGCKNVLFLTKKKAISSITDDYKMYSPDYNITVINYESIHKVDMSIGFDLIVLDEAHGLGAFPKPSKRAKQVSTIIKKYNPYVIFLSGTPTPESYCQIYHQVYGLKNNPFSQYRNFYRFCDEHVNVTTRLINGFNIKDYSNGKESINQLMKKYI